MASATVRMVSKTRTVTETYEDKDGVVLELNHEEAVLLAALLGWKVVGGGSLRSVSTRIFSALAALGYSSYEKFGNDVNRAKEEMYGTVSIQGA